MLSVIEVPPFRPSNKDFTGSFGRILSNVRIPGRILCNPAGSSRILQDPKNPVGSEEDFHQGRLRSSPPSVRSVNREKTSEGAPLVGFPVEMQVLLASLSLRREKGLFVVRFPRLSILAPVNCFSRLATG